jgi:hypothetical protein
MKMFAGCVGAVLVLLSAGAAVGGESCETNYSGTFAAIQDLIFERYGCTSSICHGNGGMMGELDLSPGVAHQNLFNQPSRTVEGATRVFPGERTRSLLYLNLAAKTLPTQFTAPLRAMPLDPQPAITFDELEAVRMWIEAGAPATGTVDGTQDRLNACLPPPKPIEIEPLPPPPAGEGAQIHMPRWIVEANSEHEVCYASYYDLTDQVPEEFRGPAGDTVRFKQTEIRQDPHSHHLIVNLYSGETPLTDAVWGGFKCRGGAADGQACDPTDPDACGADSTGCANDPLTSIACFGQPNLPGDAVTGLDTAGFTAAQKAASTITLAPGVYNEIPLKGVIIWNSHAFNHTDEDAKLEAWINLHFAGPDEQRFPLRGIFEADPPILFKMTVPPFTAEEVCQVYTLPRHAKLFELTSHMHQRGKRFRIFSGNWECNGGPNDGQACSPFGPDEEYQTTDLCAGRPCQARRPPKAGDCDRNLRISIDELLRGVNIVLGTATVDECPRFDMDEDGVVAITDLIAAVASAFESAMRDPDESLLYTNRIYNDPIVLTFDPPKLLGGESSVRAERSLTYCAVYDNVLPPNEDKVKRQSTSPPTPFGVPDLFGGPCVTPTGCVTGKVGSPCSGETPEARNASCDTEGNPGSGLCDACVLKGGVTTEDEMFLLSGSFFVEQ